MTQIVTVIAYSDYRIYLTYVFYLYYSVDSIHEKNSQSLQTEQYMNVKPQQQLSTETTFVGKYKICKR